MDLSQLVASLPEEDVRRATAHASWSRPRSTSYERLAFVGDSLLDVIITQHLDRVFDQTDFGPGVLTRIRARVVSDETLRVVAQRIGLDVRAVELAPEDFHAHARTLVDTGKPLASMLEAIIAVCWRTHGPELTANAVIKTFAPELDQAELEPVDRKSMLQEVLAKTGETVVYRAGPPTGPSHQPTFEVEAVREPGGIVIGFGSGPSKKAAEAQAAGEALELMEGKS